MTTVSSSKHGELSTNFERSVIKRREIVHYKVARFWRDRGFKGSFVVGQIPIYMRIVRRVDPDFAKIQLDTKPVRYRSGRTLELEPELPRCAIVKLGY
jgi:hypothetical protein